MFKMVSTTSGISPSFPSRNLKISTGYSMSDHHFCHQLIQKMTTDFVRFTKVILKFIHDVYPYLRF